jgi:alpha-beta hydrolase superfamily lysophospholipase
MYKEFVESFLFFPDQNIMDTPESYQIPFQDVFVSKENQERYHAWFMESKGPYVILFFHGNAGNISTRISFFKKLYEHHFSILAFDYPGFGKSQGKSTEESCQQAALLFFHFLQNEKKYSRKKIILWGESIGGSLATLLSLTTHSPSLVLQSTFTDIQEIIHKVAPKIPSFIYHSVRFETKKYLKKRYQMAKLNKEMKTLLIHSREDELIPYTHAEFLKKYANDLWECGGKHSSPKMNEAFFKRIMDFLL